MSFTIPWRLLIPPGSVETVLGRDEGQTLQQKTGAKVSVSSSEEAPVTLSDKIVKIEGSSSEKEDALAHIVAELFEFQGTPDDEDGLCVLVMPACAIGAVIGTKGAKISEIMAESGCEIDVGRECIIGMPDNPVVLRGRPKQIVKAALLSNLVLQDLAEKGNRASPSLNLNDSYEATTHGDNILQKSCTYDDRLYRIKMSHQNDLSLSIYEDRSKDPCKGFSKG